MARFRMTALRAIGLRLGCTVIAAAIVAAIAVLGCTRHDVAEPEFVRVTMKDRAGAEVGEVHLQDTSNGVLVRGRFSGLPPGDHAFHIHETGKCEPPFDTAGGHLHEAGSEHGFANRRGFHAGDLPNVHVPESGAVTVEVFASKVRLHDGGAPLLDADGFALVLHDGADDHRTDPAGAAGDRIACGTTGALPQVSGR